MTMRFLVDVDCVLGDFLTPARKAIERVLGRPWSFDELPADEFDMFSTLTPEQHKVVFTLLNAPGFCRDMKPLPGAQQFIKRLCKLLGGNIYACTSPNDAPHWVYERDIWLERFFQIDRQHTIHTQCKYVCSGDFLLDDRPSHIIRWRQEHPSGVGMLWSTENNTRLKGYGDIRKRSFNEVLERVKAELKDA